MLPFSNQDTSASVNNVNRNLFIEQCFICSSEINNSVETFDFHLCTRFQVIVGRYFNIRLTEVGLDCRKTLENFSLKKGSSNNEKHFLCDGCLPTVKSFCDLYENWCLLQMRMNHSLQEIGNLMKNTTKNTKSTQKLPDANNNQQRKAKLASLFRNRFLHRLEDGSLDKTPRLKLQRLDDHDETLGGNDDDDADCILIEPIGDPYADPNLYPATILDTPSKNLKSNHVTMVSTDNKDKASSSLARGIPLSSTMTTSVTPEQFKCRFCNLLMPSQASINRHELQTHKVDHYWHKSADDSKMSEIYKCAHRYCDQRFSTVFALRKHQERFHNEKLYADHIGSECVAKPPKISKNSTHQFFNKPKKFIFKCRYCYQTFSSFELRKLHEKSHENQPCYVCGIGGCAQSFETSSDLLFHRRFDRHDRGTEETEIQKECVENDVHDDDDDDASLVYRIKILPNCK